MSPRFDRSFCIMPTSGCEIFDGTVVVQTLHPKTPSTFKDFLQTVFVPYVQGQLQSAQRIDFAWDTYKPDSTKTGTREKRGCGARRRVAPTVKIPSNWKSFLRIDDNKTELFRLRSGGRKHRRFRQRRVQYKWHASSEQYNKRESRRPLAMQPQRSGQLNVFTCSRCCQVTPTNHDKDNRYRCLRSGCLADAENSSQRSLACFWHGKAV